MAIFSPMLASPELDNLAARWAESPTSTCFAALADGLRKSGALDQAAGIAMQGIVAQPGYLPGHLVLARVYLDQREWIGAAAELRTALRLDADHPIAQELLASIPAETVAIEDRPPADTASPPAAPMEDEATDLVFTHEGPDDPSSDGEVVVTESMAMLYWRQGHLAQAVDVFEALVARQPSNVELIVRRDKARAEFDGSRPAAPDAPQPSGRKVREWLSAIATARAETQHRPSSFDAFYEAPPALPPSEPSDLAAFQAWLKELDR